MYLQPGRLLSRGGSTAIPTLDYNYVSTMALGGLETFTRASTGWYYNSSGVLTSAATDAPRFSYDPSTARTNLLLRSAQQDVGGVWTVSQIAVTADTVTDPLGAQNADTFTENSGSTSRGTAQNASIATNVTQTFSVYAKAGSRSWLRLMLNTGADSVICWFNLGSGAVGSTAVEGSGSAPVGAITNAGSGWYRCALTGIPSSANSGSISAFIRMATADSEFSYQGNGTGTLHVWGAQLELGASATAYIATAAATVTTCTALGLLIEEARTNLCPQSQTLGTTWAATRASVTADAAVAPDGTTTADKLVEDNTATNTHFSVISFTLTASTSYTVSAYVKAAGRTSFRMLLKDNSTGTNFFSAIFDLSAVSVNSTLVNGTGTIAASSITAINNGWYRVSMTGIPFTSGSGAALNIYTIQDAATITYTGDNASGVYVWGVQVEAGLFATSYIPTVASSVTRAADVCGIATLGSWFNASAGTLLIDYTLMFRKTAGVQIGVMIDDGTNNNRIGIFATDGVGQSAPIITLSSVAQFGGSTGTPVAGTRYVTALAYATNDGAFYRDGVQRLTDTSVTLPTVTQMRIGHRTTDQLNGWLRRITVFDKRVPDYLLPLITA